MSSWRQVPLCHCTTRYQERGKTDPHLANSRARGRGTPAATGARWRTRSANIWMVADRTPAAAHVASPVRWATPAASVRLRTFSLERIRETCTLPVFSAMNS